MPYKNKNTLQSKNGNINYFVSTYIKKWPRLPSVHDSAILMMLNYLRVAILYISLNISHFYKEPLIVIVWEEWDYIIFLIKTNSIRLISMFFVSIVKMKRKMKESNVIIYFMKCCLDLKKLHLILQ